MKDSERENSCLKNAVAEWKQYGPECQAKLALGAIKNEETIEG